MHMALALTSSNSRKIKQKSTAVFAVVLYVTWPPIWVPAAFCHHFQNHNELWNLLQVNIT